MLRHLLLLQAPRALPERVVGFRLQPLRCLPLLPRPTGVLEQNPELPNLVLQCRQRPGYICPWIRLAGDLGLAATNGSVGGVCGACTDRQMAASLPASPQVLLDHTPRSHPQLSSLPLNTHSLSGAPTAQPLHCIVLQALLEAVEAHGVEAGGVDTQHVAVAGVEAGHHFGRSWPPASPIPGQLRCCAPAGHGPSSCRQAAS